MDMIPAYSKLELTARSYGNHKDVIPLVEGQGNIMEITRGGMRNMLGPSITWSKGPIL
jgi:hypothetical protein